MLRVENDNLSGTKFELLNDWYSGTEGVFYNHYTSFSNKKSHYTKINLEYHVSLLPTHAINKEAIIHELLQKFDYVYFIAHAIIKGNEANYLCCTLMQLIV